MHNTTLTNQQQQLTCNQTVKRSIAAWHENNQKVVTQQLDCWCICKVNLDSDPSLCLSEFKKECERYKPRYVIQYYQSMLNKITDSIEENTNEAGSIAQIQQWLNLYNVPYIIQNSNTY